MKKFILLLFLSLVTLNYIDSQTWIFAEQFASSGDVEPVDIKVDGNGDIYIVGDYTQTLTISSLPPLTYTGTDQDIFLCKFNEQGTAQWARRIGGDARDRVGGLAIDPSNNVYVVGGFRSPILSFEGGTTTLINDDNYDAFLAKYDGSGSLIFADSVFWGSDVERLMDVTYDFTNDYIVSVGHFRTELKYDDGGEQTIPVTGPSTKNLLLVRHDPNGIFVDIQTFYGSLPQPLFKDVNNSIVGGAVNGYFVTGDLRGTLYFSPTDSIVGGTTAMDILVVRFEDDLSYDWSRNGGGTSYEHVNSSGADGYGNVYFTGKAQSASIVLDSTATIKSAPRPTLGGLWDFLIAKYNRDGNLQWFRRDGGPGQDNAYGLSVRGKRILYSGTVEQAGNVQSGFAVYHRDGNLIATDQITGDSIETGLNVAFDLSGDSTLVIGNFNGDSLKAGPYRLDNTAPPALDGFFVKYGFKFNVYVADQVNVECNGDETGYIELVTEFGTEPISYAWTPNVSDSSTAADLPAGDYQIIATDDGGRVDTIVVTITEPEAINIVEDSVFATSCHALSTSGTKNDGKAYISVTGGTEPYSYLWTGGGTQQDNTSLTAGDQTITVTDDKGCHAIDTITIPQPNQMTFAGSVVDTIRIPPGGNGAVHLNTQGGTPGYSFDWSGPSGYTSTEDTIRNLVNAGQYNLSVTDANLCLQDTSFTVPADTGITIEVYDIIHVRCKGESNGGAKVRVVFGGSGNYAYEWRTTLGIVIGGNEPQISGLPFGTYYIKVTDIDSASVDERSFVIEEPANSLVAAIDSTKHISCFGNSDGYLSVDVTGGWGGYTYLWTPSGSKEFFANNLYEGENTVTITDANGCEKILSKDINEPAELVATITLVDPILCNGDEDGTLSAETSTGGDPPYTYMWDDPGAQTTSIATNLPAGTYRVDLTDAKGCTAFDTEILGEPNLLSLVSLEPTWDGSIGTIDVIVDGGTPDYTYTLTGPTPRDSVTFSNSITFIDLTGGDYTITVYDANNCGALQDDINVSIENLYIGVNLKLYPNPSTGEFTIEFDNTDAEDVILEIVNMSGQLIYKKLHKYNGNPRFIETIDLGNQARGTYLLRVNGLPVKAKLMIE